MLTAGQSLIYVLKWIVDKSAAGQMNGKGVTTAVSTYDSISTLIIHFDLWAKLWLKKVVVFKCKMRGTGLGSCAVLLFQ